MTPSKGVKIEEMGKKFECNGVDNGMCAVVVTCLSRLNFKGMLVVSSKG